MSYWESEKMNCISGPDGANGASGSGNVQQSVSAPDASAGQSGGISSGGTPVENDQQSAGQAVRQQQADPAPNGDCVYRPGP